MFRKILIPLDGSHYSDLALKSATRLARELKSSLLLLHVMEIKRFAFLHDDYTGGLVNFLNETVSDLQKKGKLLLENAQKGIHGVETKTRLELGDPAPVICDVGREEGCDLIVMGSRGLNDFIGFFLGSVSHRVLQHSTIPVLLVRNQLKEMLGKEKDVAVMAEKK